MGLFRILTQNCILIKKICQQYQFCSKYIFFLSITADIRNLCHIFICRLKIALQEHFFFKTFNVLL